MCGRYYRRSDKQRIAEAYRLGEIPFDLVLPDWNFNVAPTSFQPVIRLRRDVPARRDAGLDREADGREPGAQERLDVDIPFRLHQQPFAGAPAQHLIERGRRTPDGNAARFGRRQRELAPRFTYAGGIRASENERGKTPEGRNLAGLAQSHLLFQKRIALPRQQQFHQAVYCDQKLF